MYVYALMVQMYAISAQIGEVTVVTVVVVKVRCCVGVCRPNDLKYPLPQTGTQHDSLCN